MRASFPEITDGRVLVAGHSQHAHPIGGDTSQVRVGAAMLGHPFQSSTVFGRRSAWAALCDCRDQGMYDVPEQVARWAFGNPASSRIFPEVYSKLVFIYKYI